MNSHSRHQSPGSAEADESSSILMPAGFGGGKNSSYAEHSGSGTPSEANDGAVRLDLKG